MIRASHVMPRVVAEVIRKAPLTPEKVAFAWRMAVGPAISNATSVRLDDEGRLHVRCDTRAWAAAVQKSAPMIRERLTALLGAGAVTSLHFES